MLTKTLHFDLDIVELLSRSLRVDRQNGNFVGVLTCGQLDRKTYERVNKALEAMGGKWSRKAGGHIFSYDPMGQLTGLLDTGKVTVARDGWFPTPAHIVDQMVDAVGYGDGWILEPSAGEGHIADVISRVTGRDRFDCVENNPNRAAILRQKGYQVTEADFLTCTLATFSRLDFARVFMNPPFEEGQDIQHVQHAHGLLQPGGAMAAIMSEGPFFRMDNQAADFRAWLASVGGYAEPLLADSFKTSGTGVNARMVIIQ